VVQERTKVAQHYAPQLIISVNEMRKLLGAESKDMTDDQIELLIITLTESSSMMLNQKTVPKI
jgi:Ca2+-binding EF-hand superfamily protein